MNFNKLIALLLEGLWPKNWLTLPKKGPVTEPEIFIPTRKIDKKGWLKNNKIWIPVDGVHARPEYINELNKENSSKKSVHTVSRDLLEQCILEGHTRVALSSGIIHIECRSLQTGKAALAVLQRMFSDVMERKVIIDVLNEASYEVDVNGKVLSRNTANAGSNVYTL